MEQENYKGGAKTPEGKAVSKMNALKHGLLSSEVLLANDDPKVLEELARGVRESLMPVGQIEEILVDRIISNVWRLRRALQVEQGTMQWFIEGVDEGLSFGNRSKDIEKLKDTLDNDAVEKVIRYENSIERSMFKALHELERMQARRNGKDIPLPIPIDVDTGKNE
jgi:hypothetical protein